MKFYISMLSLFLVLFFLSCDKEEKVSPDQYDYTFQQGMEGWIGDFGGLPGRRGIFL